MRTCIQPLAKHLQTLQPCIFWLSVAVSNVSGTDLALLLCTYY